MNKKSLDPELFKALAIVGLALSVLPTLFFVANDIRFLRHLINGTHSAFVSMSRLEPWQDMLAIAVFLLLTIALHVTAGLQVWRKHYRKAFLGYCGAIFLFVLQLAFWTLCTIEKG